MAYNVANFNEYKGVKVLVVGASGFIGRWVAYYLYQEKADLYLMARNPACLKGILSSYNIQGKIYQIDLRNSETVKEQINEIKPAITFNLAGYGIDPSENDENLSFQINADLVRNIGECLVKTRKLEWGGQEFIHVGTALEYGDIGGDLTEDSIPTPATLYGKSKLAGTQYLADVCQQSGLKGLTARLFTVYGPGERPGRLLPSLLQAARTSDPIPLSKGEQKRDFTFVKDIAEGLLRLGLVQAVPGEIVNLATGCLTSVRDFIERASRVLNIPSSRLIFGAIPAKPWEMTHLPVSVNRLRNLTGWIPQTIIEEGIRQTILYEG